MLDREQLKLSLEQIVHNGYAVPAGENALSYLESMLAHIGDTDAHLRDDLIYETFCDWICEKEVFDVATISNLLAELLNDKHLFYCIGNNGDTSIFTRSFSMLAIVQVLCLHRKRNVLDAMQFDKAKSKVLQYLMTEVDFRGFTYEYGWAHAAAHGADALVELVQCEACEETDFKNILECITRVLRNGRYILSHEEDERLTNAAVLLYKLHPTLQPQVTVWLEELPRLDGIMDHRQKYIARVNTKILVRSLYFRCLHAQAAPDLQTVLIRVEKQLNRFA